MKTSGKSIKSWNGMNKYEVFHYKAEEYIYPERNYLIYYTKKYNKYIGYNVFPFSKKKWTCAEEFNPNEQYLLKKLMVFYE